VGRGSAMACHSLEGMAWRQVWGRGRKCMRNSRCGVIGVNGAQGMCRPRIPEWRPRSSVGRRESGAYHAKEMERW